MTEEKLREFNFALNEICIHYLQAQLDLDFIAIIENMNPHRKREISEQLDDKESEMIAELKKIYESLPSKDKRN